MKIQRNVIWYSLCLFALLGSTPPTFAKASLTSAVEEAAEFDVIIGRWDWKIQENGKEAPAWMVVKLSGTRTLVGSFVGSSGSARPVSEVHFDQGKFHFSLPPQWETGDLDFVIEGSVEG